MSNNVSPFGSLKQKVSSFVLFDQITALKRTAEVVGWDRATFATIGTVFCHELQANHFFHVCGMIFVWYRQLLALATATFASGVNSTSLFVKFEGNTWNNRLSRLE